MRKNLLLLVVLCFLSYRTFAQSSTTEGSKFSIGINPGLPIGDASDVYTFGLGGDLKFEQPVATNTFVSLSAGYTAFFTKSEFKDLGAKSSYGFVPIKVGLKYYFNEGFFAEGQIGATFSTESGGGTAFAYAPGIGYTLDNGFEAGFRFEGWSKDGSFNQLALRLAYRF